MSSRRGCKLVAFCGTITSSILNNTFKLDNTTHLQILGQIPPGVGIIVLEFVSRWDKSSRILTLERYCYWYWSPRMFVKFGDDAGRQTVGHFQRLLSSDNTSMNSTVNSSVKKWGTSYLSSITVLHGVYFIRLQYHAKTARISSNILCIIKLLKYLENLEQHAHVFSSCALQKETISALLQAP